MELTWGAEWKKTQKRYAKPYVACAAELAVDGLQLLGIRPTAEGEFRARRVARTAEIDGEQCGTVAELSICTQDVKRRRLPRIMDNLCRVAIHELTHVEHTARMGALIENLSGDAVSEGLAYCIETQFGQMLSPSNDSDVVDAALHGPATDHLIARLMIDSANCCWGTAEGDDLHSKWFEKCNNAWAAPLGVVLGIRGVSVAHSQGVAYEEILEMDPSAVLQLSA